MLAAPPALGVEPSQVRAGLDRVLASRLFARAERHRRFLQFIVTETLAGRGDRLKGYTIGVHVFDCDPDFDPSLDAIVRVECLLRWIEAFWGYTPPASQNARDLFARAVALDPGWTAGHAWLARAQAFRWVPVTRGE